MAEKFLMPKLSPTMEEGQISRWVKNEGDTFEANETLAEVDTDKATMEMTALSGGTLLKILKAGGETAALGEAIAIIGQKGEDISALLAETLRPTAEPRQNRRRHQRPTGERRSNNSSPRLSSRTRAEATRVPTRPPRHRRQPHNPVQRSNGRMIVSPIAARMAADNGIDLKTITGTGPNGRIIKRDIETALAGGRNTTSRRRKLVYASTIVGASPFRDEPTSQMRRVIASRLAESIGPVPTFYLTVEIEMDNALALRKQINATLDRRDQKISVNDIIVKAAAMALHEASVRQRVVSGQDRSAFTSRPTSASPSPSTRA